jgi:rubrerythrin
MEGQQMNWVCNVCGYIHDEEQPPDPCPVCGAPQDKFSKIEEKTGE